MHGPCPEGVLNRITLQPRSPEARALKDLVLRISDVRTANDRLWWLRSFRDWDELNAAFACEKAARPGGQTYFVRDDLRKAYVHLKRAIPNLFTFVDHPGLPKTTNALEAFFGHLKDQLRLHRGLSETRVDNFIKWYLYFNDEKKKNR